MEWFFMAIGLFAISGSLFDWEWFMTHRKTRFFVAVFGRTGARIFYALLGLLLVGLGIALLAGFIEPPKRG
jgi:small neutral amino acid transporter SnatA (MarC family)